MTTTIKGRLLRQELNDALGGVARIPLSLDSDVSLLARRAQRYANRQERACSIEGCWGEKWDAADARLEQSIRELAESIPGIVSVRFQGDPRGHTVVVELANGATNRWDREGWGIA